MIVGVPGEPHGPWRLKILGSLGFTKHPPTPPPTHTRSHLPSRCGRGGTDFCCPEMAGDYVCIWWLYKSHPNPASHPIQPATHSQSQQTCHLYPQLPILSSDLSPLVQSVHRSLLSTYYVPGTHLGIADEQGKQNLLWIYIPLGQLENLPGRQRNLIISDCRRCYKLANQSNVPWGERV